MSQDEIEARKKRAERGWIVAPSPTPTTAAEKVMDRYLRRTPEERAAMIEAGNRRYAHRANQRRDGIADLRKNRPAKD